MLDADPNDTLTLLQQGAAQVPDDRNIATTLLGENLERRMRDEAVEQAYIVWGEDPERKQEAEAYVDDCLNSY